MEGNRQRRLLADSSELSNPPPGLDWRPGVFSPDWGPGEPRSPTALAASALGHPRNLNCGAKRNCPKPVAGRLSRTFASPCRVFRSVGRDLLARHASLDERRRMQLPALSLPVGE